MKVTFLCPLNGNLNPGGAEQQAFQTAHELRNLGVEIEYLTPMSTDLGDLVHAFGPYNEYERVQSFAHHRNIPFVISSIFYKDFSLFDAFKYKYRRNISGHENRSLDKLFKRSDAILPNSHEEVRQLLSLHKINRSKTNIIPNGAETRFKSASPSLFREHFNITDEFILNVGRIEPRKNQVRLAAAAKLLGKQLIIVGNPVLENYMAEVLKSGGEFVKFIPALHHDSPLLESAYAACKVFALPSTLETPGIAALEAALAGAPIVITPIGGPKEYFLDYAEYPRISDENSIAESILRKWNAPNSTRLQEHIMNEYNWKAVGEKTLNVYKTLLL
jgi:glycosyltransferase involved in cell wall biosynthesis